jgi:chitinase
MLGVNDVAGERFTVPDARRLATFAGRVGLPRVSAWSLNRDSECGAAFAQLGVASNTCSGVAQSPLQFTRILSRLPGTTRARTITAAASAAPETAAEVPDDQAGSPYPVWQATAAYTTGFQVVWQHAIYQAKWWSQGTAPDSIAAGTASSWLLIGPVPAGSHAPVAQLLDTRHHPTWSPGAVYHAGDRVTFGGLPFQARYWTRGDQPSSGLPATPQSPWEPLYTDRGEPVAAATAAEVNR